MNRRIWIRQMVIAGGAVLLLPACMNDEGAVSISLKNISITPKEETLLAEMAEAIIPATGTPGAKALNLHQFVLKMFDDCYDQAQQQQLISGLRKLNDFADETKGKPFLKLSTEQKPELLRAIANSKSAATELKVFLAETRRWVIKGYSTSEYVMTKLVPYELVPGRFHGCVPVTKSE